MTQQTIDLHINLSDEAIRLGPLTVRFLITRENSCGRIAAFEPIVLSAQRLAAPANSDDQDAKTLCVITPAPIVPQYFGESAGGINEAAGGELARW